MIEGYQIKKENNEEVLYLNISTNYEFSSDSNTKHNTSLKKEIKKYIKKINFTGKKIVLSVSGIALAFLVAIKNPVNDTLNLVYINNSIIPNNNINYVINKTSDTKKIITIKETMINDEVNNNETNLNKIEEENINSNTTVVEKKEKELNNRREK